jgi:Arc/MetJ-type ribon-helix-helix transcriptional regulator
MLQLNCVDHCHLRKQEYLGMKIIQVELPPQTAEEIATLIQDGWFLDEKEIVRLALKEFVEHHRFTLLEQQQRQDIAWAVQQHETNR